MHTKNTGLIDNLCINNANPDIQDIDGNTPLVIHHHIDECYNQEIRRYSQMYHPQVSSIKREYAVSLYDIEMIKERQLYTYQSSTN